MSQEDDSGRLAELIDSVADGLGVDWDAAGAPPIDAHLRRLFEALQLVERISEVHRSEIAETQPALTAVLAGPRVPSLPTDSSVPTDWPSAQWGHFELLQKLGEGAFGEVYQARDTWLEHSVALKLLKPPLVDRTRFLHEARTLARIRHPNVVAIHGADEHGGRLGFWMDFIDGPTLADVVEREGVRSASEAVIIGQDLCRAMAAVHATGIVHRDIKAQNVIRHSGTGRVILMDFGAGEPMNADLTQRRPTGTPLYMAPELFDGSIATRESDIYALGVLLYYLVTRSYPVHGESIKELLRAHAKGDRHHLGDMRPDLPDDFVRVVETMIARDSPNRFHSATEVRKALEDTVVPRGDSVHTGIDRGAKPRFAAWLHNATDWRQVARRVALTITIVLCLVTLGAISRVVQATAFGSVDYGGRGGPIEWFVSGVMVIVATVVHVAFEGVLFLAMVVVARLAVRLIPAVERIVESAIARTRTFVETRRLDDPDLLVQSISCACACACIVLAFARWPEVSVFAISIADAPLERLAQLQPANEFRFDFVQRTLEVILLVYGIVASVVYSIVRQRNLKISLMTKFAAIGIPVAAYVVLHVMPYRIVYQNEKPRRDNATERCYDLGWADSRSLLFCPDATARMNPIPSAPPPANDNRPTESIFIPRDKAARLPVTPTTK